MRSPCSTSGSDCRKECVEAPLRELAIVGIENEPGGMPLLDQTRDCRAQMRLLTPWDLRIAPGQIRTIVRGEEHDEVFQVTITIALIIPVGDAFEHE